MNSYSEGNRMHSVFEIKTLDVHWIPKWNVWWEDLYLYLNFCGYNTKIVDGNFNVT